MPAPARTSPNTRPRTASLALLASLFTACGNLDNSPQARLEAARRAWDSGDRTAAVIELKNVLKEDPDLGEARWMLGRSLLLAGDAAAAEKEIARAQAAGYDMPDVELARLSALMLMRRYEEVLKRTPAIDSPDATADLLGMRAEAQISLNKLEAAKQTLAKALSLQPDSLTLALASVRIAILEGQLDRAIELVDAADRKHPGELNLALSRGWVESLRGASEQAAAAYRAGLAIAPDNPSARLGLVRALVTAKDTSAARRELQPLLATFARHPDVVYFQALLDYLDNRVQPAVDALRKSLSLAPSHTASQFLLAQLLYRQRQYEQADDLLQPVLKKYPDYPPAVALFAAVKLARGAPDKAVEALLGADPGTKGTPDPFSLAMLGSAYVGQQDYGKAINTLERAAEAAPEAVGIRTMLAMSRMAGGDEATGLGELEALAAESATVTQAESLLIRTHLEAADFKAVLADADRLEAKQPGTAIPHNLRGLAWVGMGEAAKGRAAFEQALAIAPDLIAAQMNLANLDIVERKPAEARARLGRILQQAPDHVAALTALGGLQAGAGEIETAVATLEKARAAASNDFRSRLLLAALYERTGREPLALKIAEEAYAIAPTLPPTRLRLGTARLANGQAGQALELLEPLAAERPDDAAVLLALADAQARTGALEAAAKALDHARASAPDAAAPRLAQARLALISDDAGTAARIAAELQGTRPDDPDVQVLLGEVAAAQGQPAAQRTAWERAFELAPTTANAVRMFVARVAAGDQEGALAGLRAWVVEHPADATAALTLASAYERLNRKDEARGQYEALLKSSPDVVVALNNLSLIYLDAKDARAVGLAERAYELAPGDPDVTDTLGWILVETGTVERGMQLLRSAVKARPDDSSFQYHLAVGLARSGALDDAAATVKKLLASPAAFPERAAAEQLLLSLDR